MATLDDPTNYRDISFMNCVAKVFMVILNKRLHTWIKTHKVMVKYQSGFRKGYSTADNIYNLSAIVDIKIAEKKSLCFLCRS